MTTYEINENSITDALGIKIINTTGVGTITLPAQGTEPPNPSASNLSIYASADTNLSWKIPSGVVSSFDTSAISADRVWNLPDISGNVMTDNSTNTITNKTISHTTNTVDAGYIIGSQVIGSPGNGDILEYVSGSSQWQPLTLAATTPLQYSNGTFSAAVGATAGTLTAGNDGRLSTPQYILVKVSNAGSGEFTSIGAALASILDAGPTKPYVIDIGPGIYTENAMTITSWIRVQGSGLVNTTINPSANSITLFTMNSITAINDLTLQGLGGTGTAININSTSNALINNITIVNFPTGVYMKASTAVANIAITNSSISAPFVNGIVLDGTTLNSSFACTLISSNNTINGNASCTNGIFIEGPFASANISSNRISSLSNGTGILIQDGSILTTNGSQIATCNYGVNVANVGAAPFIRISSMTIFNCIVQGLNILHPSASGAISCIVDRTQLNIESTANLSLFFTDPDDSGTAIVGDFLYTPNNGGTLTEHGELFQKSSSIGLVDGGVLSAGAGTIINISSGTGYIENTNAQSQLIKQVWNNGSITLPASSVSYIYIAEDGTYSSALSLPNPIESIILGRVGTTATGIEFIDAQLFSSYHPNVSDIMMSRDIFGAVYDSGSIVSDDPSRELSISPGIYYYNNNQIATTGQASPATWFAYYHAGGVFTRAAQTVIDNAQYDNGTSLTPIIIGMYVMHTLYTVGSGVTEQYFLVYGQVQFTTIQDTETGSLPIPPNYFSEGIALIAGIIVQQGVSTIVEIRDLRSGLVATANTRAVITKHGDLTGLLNDDHTQYVLTNGTRAMAGTFDMGGNNIININTANGVTIEAHASRHLPTGADPLTTAAPLTTLTTATTNTVGTANSFARSDHTHAIDQTTFSLNQLIGPLNVPNGGTGATTFTANNFLQGNGSSIITAVKAVPSGVVVGTTDTQTLTNKNLDDTTTFITNSTDPTIMITFDADSSTGTTTTIESISTLNRIITLPDATTTLTGTNNSATLSNKTMDSASNTLTITNSPLSAVNVNSLINQDVRTSASPTFAGLTSVGLTLTGVANDNTITELIGVGSGNVIKYKNNVVDTTTVQTLSSKTLDSASNTLTITNSPLSAVNVNSLINQDVRTSASPTFTGLTSVGLTLTGVANDNTITELIGVGSGNVIKYKNNIVDTTTVQTLSNKNFVDNSTAIVDSTDATIKILFDAAGTTGTSTTLLGSQTANRIITLPDATTTLTGTNNAATLSNKTMDSASNTLTITNSPLSAVNVNSLINQDIRTSASPTFAGLTSAGLTLTGVTHDNTITNILGLNGSNIVEYKNNIADTTAVQTFSNKTLDSASNTLTITNSPLSAANVNSLINQDVRTSASPTFVDLTLTGVANDNTITNILGVSSDNIVEYKNNIADVSTAQTLTNKSLKVPSCKLVDNSDASKVIFFNTASSTTGTNTTLLFNQTANRGITFPDANYNVVGDTNTQTLTNKLMQGDKYWDGTGQTIQFATGALTGPRTWTAADGSGTVLLDTQSQNVYNKTFDNTSTLQGTYIVGNYTSNTTTDHPIEFNTSGLTSERTITWSDSAGIVVLDGNTLTLTNKTMDSASNTLTITNSPLSVVNVNSLINQDIRTSASPTFADLTLTGVANDNTITELIGVGSGNVIKYKNNVVDTTTVQTLSNKTLDSASDTLTITNSPLSAVNVNSLINQDVRTSATPTWNTVNLSQIVGSPLTIAGTAWGPFVSSVNTNLGQNVSPTASPSFVGLTLTGVANDNTITELIGLNGSNIVKYKNNVVDTSTVQTLTNKTLTAPVISTIVNTGTLTLPTATDTLVARTTTDTLTNKTLTAPVISTIVNTGTLTLPTVTDTLVARTTTDTLTNKTLTAPVISTIVNTGTLTLPTATDTLVARTTTDTLTNKTINSANNTLTITNTPLNAVNVNSLINQDVRTTASPVFNVITANGNISSNSAATNAELQCSQNIVNRKIVLYDTGGGSPNNFQFYGFGVASNILQYVAGATSADHVFYAAANNTTFNEVARIKGNNGGIIIPITGTSSYQLNGAGDYAYSANAGNYFSNAAQGDINLRTQNTANSLNLGVGGASAQLQIQNTAINLNAESVYYVSGTKASMIYPVSGSEAFGASSTLLTVATTTNTAGAIYVYIAYRKLTGTITGYGSFLYDFKFINNAGTVTTTTGNNTAKSETSIAGTFTGKTTIAAAASGTNVNVNLSNTFTDTSLFFGGNIEVMYA